MTTDWTRLAAAIERYRQAYFNVLATRAEEREGSKKWKAAFAEYDQAHAERHAAAIEQWTPADGTWDDGLTEGGAKSAGGVIRRYYAETSTPEEGGKR